MKDNKNQNEAKNQMSVNRAKYQEYGYSKNNTNKISK